MLRNVYLTFTFIIVAGCAAYAQTGSIKGKVIDKTTNEPLPFASVVAENNGTQAGGAQTDFDGNFTIKPLNPGKYDIKATFVGYQTAEVKGVIVSVDKVSFQDVKLGKGAVDLKVLDITAYKVPLIDKGNPATQSTITAEEIKEIPTRDINSIAATAAGVYQRDEGDAINIRGSRDDANKYFIDGVKVRGSQQVPQSAIEQVTVVTGGVPAQYGDATGGIISITTKGPSNTYSGGLELSTSEVMDHYGYNLASINASGPIWMKKNSDGTKTSKLGFFISGEIELQKDPDPSAIQLYKVKDDVLNDLRLHPNKPSPVNAQSLVYRADYVRLTDLEKINYKQNIKQTVYNVAGSLDFLPAKNIDLRVGGSYEHNRHNDRANAITNWWDNALFNPNNYSQVTTDDIRAYARLTQHFGSGNEKDKKALIKNAYYSIQVDYTKNLQTYQDPSHENRLWDYGYLGKFKTLFQASKISVPFDTLWIHDGQSTIIFQPGGLNPDDEAYTSQYLSFHDPNYAQHVNDYYNNGQNNFINVTDGSTGFYNSLLGIQAGGGLLNGDSPGTVFSMWQNTGNQSDYYQKVNNDQYHVTATGSATIKNHELRIGFEYEQRIDRRWNIAPGGLWAVVRRLGNQRLVTPGTAEFTSQIGDTTYFAQTYSPATTTGFYENIRKRLGLRNDQFFDPYFYDRSYFSLDLFNPDELFGGNGGAGFYSYAGYDYKGNSQKSNPSFLDFFSAKDVNGNFKREIAPFRPIYMAGYIQDNFAVNDMIFNIGLRIDRFDANQKVLIDKYSLFATKKVGELEADPSTNFSKAPGNIGSDYVVYTSNVNTPSGYDVWGYRSGDKWFDKNGVEVADPKILAQQSPTGSIFPWLVRPGERSQDSTFHPSESFKDYDPQVTFMPRVAFQFDITDQAEFFANYSVLTQRPPNRSTITPISYLFMSSSPGGTFNNPDLKPQRSTNYELGFRQIVSRSSVLSISSFYRELKDMIEIQAINYAWPVFYNTYTNQDFGTVKGFTVEYDLRKTGNIRVKTSYTIQFANGTGSSDASGTDLINTGQPNLRNITPLDFDQRHNIKISFDYRYGEGKDYNGPVFKNKQILANTGFHIEFSGGSGTPYTPQYIATPNNNSIGLQTLGSSRVKGNINGATLPWNYKFDLNVNKEFALSIGKKREDKKPVYLNVYFKVFNLLNTKNIISVYRYTGSASDDGYLNSAIGLDQQQIYNTFGQAQSFNELYSLKENNPNNYSLPRRYRLGVELNF